VRTMTPGEGNNCSKVPIKAPLHKTMESRSPVVWVGKTMHDPTVDPDVSIGVRNPVAKRENQKSSHHCRETTQSITQRQKIQHRRDTHGEESWKECVFDLKCHQLIKIMGHQWA